MPHPAVGQARRHAGREPRWGLGMFLGAVAAMVALWASHILVATVHSAQVQPRRTIEAHTCWWDRSAAAG